jgi:integrase
MRTTLTDTAVRRIRAPESGRRLVWDAIVPGLALRITSENTRSWVVMTRLRGKLLLHTLGRYPAILLKGARKLAREALEDVARGDDPRNRRREAEKVPGTFAAVAEEFIAKSTAGDGWKAEQERLLRKHVIPRLGAARIDVVTRADVIGVLEEIVEQDKPTLANRTKAVVSKLFSWALDRELVDAHPCARLGAMMPKERKRERVLEDAEIRKLWKASDGFPFGALSRVLLVTAQRRGEVVTMRWGDVDLEAKLWRIPKTKAGHGHEVPLSGLAVKLLKSVPRVVDKGDYVFPASRGGRSFSGFSKATRRIKKAVGISDWCLHDLRRTAATNMARLGVPKTTISRVLNHAEGVTEIYARHSYLGEKRAALELWADRLAGIVTRH